MTPMRGSGMVDELPPALAAAGPGAADAAEAPRQPRRPGEGDLEVVAGEADQTARAALRLQDQDLHVPPHLGVPERLLPGRPEPAEPGRAAADLVRRDPAHGEARGL